MSGPPQEPRHHAQTADRADIIALAGNPLQDINAVMDVRFVMKDGTGYKRPEAR